MDFGTKRFFLFYAAIGFLMQAQFAVADYIEPGTVVVKTASYQIQSHQYSNGEYNYDIEWQSLPVGNASIRVRDFQHNDANYLFVEASAKSGGAVDWFYRLRHKSESLFRSDSFQPLSFTSHQTENRKEKLCEITFRDLTSSVSKPDFIRNIHAQSWKNGKKSNTVDFNSSNLTLDPISAAFYARSVNLDVGKEVSFDVFNGKHRFIISFKVLALESIEVNNKTYSAYKIEPSVRKLTDTEGETKLKKALIWISADANRDVLKLESKVWIGSVTATLHGYKAITDQKFDSNQLHAKLTNN